MRFAALFTIISCITLSTFASQVEAKADLGAGKAIYDEVCSACHARNGKGYKQLKAPALAGQQSGYLVRQLRHFQTGVRGEHPDDTLGNQMRPMSKMLKSEQDIANVVAYIQTFPIPKSTKAKGDIAAGEPLYAMCVGCHGVNAQGNEQLNAPRLNTLQDWYIKQQIQNFQSDIRGYKPEDIYGSQMKAMVMSLTSDKMLDDIAAYVSSLE